MKNSILILTSVSLNALAQIFMRYGMLKIGAVPFSAAVIAEALPAMLANVFLYFALFCYGASTVLWMLILSRVEVSFAYAFSSFGIILVTVMGSLALKEHVSLIRAAGIGIVCLGVVLVAKG
jgi:drug/metabolite transporter (DMT)-like permease